MSGTASILITGGNGGLGLALGEAFLKADEGNHVWLGVRSRREKAEALATAHAERCQVIPLDVTNSEQWTTAVETITKVSGRLDVLVNNAGHHEDALLATMTDAQWNDVLQSNLSGTFLGCRAVTRTMMGQRFGRIINISSLSALMSPAGQANYAAAKSGMVGLTQSFAKEVARAGITVNAVCPGYVETDALSAMTDDQKRAAIQRIPMRRLGRPEEVAAAVLFLASAQASYITGATLKIDGGIL
ncbi:3-oxoacyl-[acyl-carrier-protein] reductase [Roseimicrobium gellanilyticum]|uniref:3-oxoacyl-[acyl-carrier-protein] reductase n=1 Tax=Roseimicrobium gellanilyticum TaxID=748857 RepID=A0A366HFF6_9BACT|nr:3-oxoacyl-ACP reductase FabG [Roseimicrobium gellanilyticum]RBP41303.1 3-oxoacyl-[acyl-carrier-protein] reductase [Roseimicrobium gellanilyticum]